MLFWLLDVKRVQHVSLALKVNEKLGLALTLRQCPHCGHDRNAFDSLAVLVSPWSATNVACANPNFSFTFKASGYCRRCWFSTLPTLTLTNRESWFEYWMIAPYSPKPNSVGSCLKYWMLASYFHSPYTEKFRDKRSFGTRAVSE